MGDSTIKGMPAAPVVTPPAAMPPTAAPPSPQTPSAPPAVAPRDSMAGTSRTGTAAPTLDLAPTPPPKAKRDWVNPHPKGTAFISYGYNHSAYTKSDVRLKGDGYDFTLHNVTAQDKPSFGTPGKWAKNVLKTSPDVPQTVYRIGYFVTDRTYVAFSGDHMKYRMNAQQASITGHVKPEASEMFAGEFHGEKVEVGKPGTILSDLQHCDGLNNIFAEVGTFVPLVQTPKGNMTLEAYGHIAGGVVVTDTRANVFSRTEDGSFDAGEHGHENPDGFFNEVGDHSHRHTHKGFVLDGVGVGAGVGLRATFFKHGFIDAGIKGGFDKLMGFHSHDEGRGYQNIGWIQPNIAIGYQFRIAHRKP